jgi:hypothetical protein
MELDTQHQLPIFMASVEGVSLGCWFCEENLRCLAERA